MRSIPAILVLLTATPALADDQKINCPTPGVPCRVLFLNNNDIQMLLGERGVLPTAAQARSIDLAGYVTYLAGQIAASPQGAVVPAPTKDEKPAEPDKK